MKKLVKPAYHGGNLQSAAELYGLSPQDFIDFSANISWLGPPPGMTGAIERGLAMMQHYPDPRSANLVRAIAKAVHLPTDCLLVGNGSIELLYALLRALGKTRALVLEPTFNEYSRAVYSSGGTLEAFPLYGKEDWQVDLTSVSQRLAAVDLVFLCNPNNPTGQFIPRKDLVQFIADAEKRGVIVVVDEAFLDFVEDFDEQSYGVLNLVTSRSNLVVLRSFTKFFAIPGLRLGFCAANPQMIERIAWAQEPWTVNCIAQNVGELIASNELANYRAQVREQLEKARHNFSVKLKERCGLKNWGQVNYLLLDLGEGQDSTSLTQTLGRRGILVRDCRPFGERFSHYIRVAVRSPEENGLLLKELQFALERRNGLCSDSI